jgi:hypothetical protein
MRFGITAAGLMALVCAATVSVSTESAMSQGSSMKPAAPQGGMAMSAPKMSDADLIKSALSAAPASIAKGAAVMGMDDKGGVRQLRPGTNGWTCMPDMPQTPGPDPMCVDKNGLDWAMAWLGHKDPPKDKIGFGYMLLGGSDPSNTDPFAEKPAAGQKWVTTGPHVMVLNIGTHFDGYPTTSADTSVPYVMYPGTPYAHLMIPVK